MANDRAREVTASALKRLDADLATGRDDALKSLFNTMGYFPDYSWSNDLLISQQRPMATRLASMHKWEKLDRTVTDGEKPITIIAPVFKRDLALTPPASGVTADKKYESSRLVGFRPAYVYDVEQTRGKPLPQVPKVTLKDSTDKLRALAAKQGISVESDRFNGSAQGISVGGKIPLGLDLQTAQEFSALAHELAHEMLRADGEARLPKIVVETQAKAAAYVVCRGVGLETNSAAADYTHLYNGDQKTLAESLSMIQETSSKILAQLLPEQRLSPFLEKAGRSLTDVPGQSNSEAERTLSAFSTPTDQTPDRSDSISMER